MTKSADAAASMRRAITGQGVSRSESEIAQKSWPSGAPTSDAVRVQRRDARGSRRSSGELAALPADLLQHLEDQARHAVDAGVARRDDRDLRAGARALDGGARAADLLGHAGLDDLLAVDADGARDGCRSCSRRRARRRRSRAAPPAWCAPRRPGRCRRSTGSRRSARHRPGFARSAMARPRFSIARGRNGTRATANVIDRPAPASV